MKCIIPGTEVRVFGKCIHCLAKLGDEIFIESSTDTLVLKTVNSARSGFACFQFKRSFFSSFKRNTPVCSKIYSKSILSVFRGLPTLEKSVDYFTVELDMNKDKIIFIFHCKYGIKKTHELGFEDCEALKAVFTKENSINAVTHCSRPLQEALTSFNSSVSEVTLSITQSSLQLSNYIEVDHQEDTGRLLRSTVTLYADEFDGYESERDTLVTFCLKELRAILTFTGALVVELDVRFDTPGKPIIFSIDDNPNYSADFVLATLSDPSDSENHQTLSQHTTQSSTAKQTVSKTHQNHLPVSTSQHSQPLKPSNINTTSNSQPSTGTGSQNGIEFIDLTYNVEDDVIAPGNSFHDDDLDDFIIHEEPCSHSVPKLHSVPEPHSHSNNVPTQESILEESTCLPTTPPPAKKFKGVFALSDIFRPCVQDLHSILASDSDGDDF